MEIYALKESIEARASVKGSEVLASDPNRNIRVTFANRFFQKRQRRFRVFERSSQECPRACPANLPPERFVVANWADRVPE